MNQNPYEGPKFSPPFREAEHRSFRLTRSNGQPLFEDFADGAGCRKAIVVALIQQLPLLCAAAVLLDGGRVCDLLIKSMLVFWGGFLIMALAIRNKPATAESWMSLYLWLGFFPVLICFLTLTQ